MGINHLQRPSSFAFVLHFETERFTLLKMIDMENNAQIPEKPQYDAKLPVVRSASRKCFNCKLASNAFKIAGKTHHQCCHPKHEAGFENGELSAWDTLQEWYNSCESHELRV
jgi:hypothetical protein